MFDRTTDKSGPTAAASNLVLLCSYHADNRPDGLMGEMLGQRIAFSSFQSRDVFLSSNTSSLHSETPGDSNIAFLHWLFQGLLARMTIQQRDRKQRKKKSQKRSKGEDRQTNKPTEVGGKDEKEEENREHIEQAAE